MKNRIMKLFKITITVFALLLLGVVSGLVTTVGAQETENDVAYIQAVQHTNYFITPDGYSVGNGDLVEFTGTYIITGRANTNIDFYCDPFENVTYNVIIHDLNATAQAWNGLLGIDYGVTLNITVYGQNKILGHNHYGMTATYDYEEGEEPPKVNITVMENSSLLVGAQYYENEIAIDPAITVTYNEEEATCSKDWTTNQQATFSRGTPQNHLIKYAYVDDNACAFTCQIDGCISGTTPHDSRITPVIEAQGDISLNHIKECSNCKYEFGTFEHSFGEWELASETHHKRICGECFYESTKEHDVNSENTCIDCKATYAACITKGEIIKNYFFIENAVSEVAFNDGIITLLSDCSPQKWLSLQVRSNVVLNLAGYKLSNVALWIYEGAYLKIMDSSNPKTGIIDFSDGIGNEVCGDLELDGVTIGLDYFYLRQGGSMIMTDVVSNVLFDLLVSENSTITLTNVTVNGELNIEYLGGDRDSVKIISGSFKYISLFCESLYICLRDLLEEGYAFSDENGLVNNSEQEASNVTVVEHSEHTKDVTHSDSLEHWHECGCGYNFNVREPHIVESGHRCAVCERIIPAIVDTGTEIKYMTGADAAIYYTGEYEEVFIKLITGSSMSLDTVISNNVTIDLNGNFLTIHTALIIDEGGSLTICDSSSEQAGKIQMVEGKYVAFENLGRIVINSGTINGQIVLSGAELNSAPTLIINGGKLTGENTQIIAFDNFDITINSGSFENMESIFQIASTEPQGSIAINGGVFVNCTSLYYADTYYKDASELLGNENDCEKLYVDEKGNEYIFPKGEDDLPGMLMIAHKSYTFTQSENEHGYYCEKCDVSFNNEPHGNFEYVPSTSDTELHEKICGVCKYVLSTEQHFGGNATCTSLAECELCNAQYGKINENGHAGGKATCQGKAVCSSCNKPYGEIDPNNHASSETKYMQSKEDENKHLLVMSCCESIIEEGEHEDGIASCEARGICSVCSLEYGKAPQGHKYDNSCDASCNICNELREISGHSFKNACDTDCDSCGKTRQTAHAYGSDGKCVVCSAENPDYTPQEKANDTLGTGAIIGIIIGSLAVFGGGAFAVIWFVLRKKLLIK